MEGLSPLARAVPAPFKTQSACARSDCRVSLSVGLLSNASVSPATALPSAEEIMFRMTWVYERSDRGKSRVDKRRPVQENRRHSPSRTSSSSQAASRHESRRTHLAQRGRLAHATLAWRTIKAWYSLKSETLEGSLDIKSVRQSS